MDGLGVEGHKIDFRGNAIKKLFLYSQGAHPTAVLSNRLDVSRNKLETIDNIFRRMPAHIDLLDLSHNQIEKIQRMDFVDLKTRVLIRL